MVPLMDSLEDKEFPKLSQEVQRTIFFEFGSVEEHYKYHDAVKILDPKGFAKMLDSIICTGKLMRIVSEH